MWYAVGRAIYCSLLACSDPSRWGSIWCGDSLKHGEATLSQSCGPPHSLASSRNAHTCARTKHPYTFSNTLARHLRISNTIATHYQHINNTIEWTQHPTVEPTQHHPTHRGRGVQGCVSLVSHAHVPALRRQLRTQSAHAGAVCPGGPF